MRAPKVIYGEAPVDHVASPLRVSGPGLAGLLLGAGFAALIKSDSFRFGTPAAFSVAISRGLCRRGQGTRYLSGGPCKAATPAVEYPLPHGWAGFLCSRALRRKDKEGQGTRCVSGGPRG
jgi:hypothetical protein